MSKNVPKECTDFPVGSTIEIEVFNVNDNDNNNDTGTINSDSDSDGSTSSLSSVHYIGRVLSNTLRLQQLRLISVPIFSHTFQRRRICS